MRRRLAVAGLALATLWPTTAGAAGTSPTPEPRPGQAEMGQTLQKSVAPTRQAAPRTSTLATDPTDPTALTPPAPYPGVEGIDVASHQGVVDWAAWWADGKRFAYVKATESTSYRNPYFAQQYTGSYDQGFLRGAYHFASPHRSSGAAQAEFFVANGGGWTPDGRTLPGVLDIEYNPYPSSNGLNSCYSMSQSQLRAWVKDFSATYRRLTGRSPVIYTTADWWNRCLGSTTAFSERLWIARYAATPGTMPTSWLTRGWKFWQYSWQPIDQDVYQGSLTEMTKWATWTPAGYAENYGYPTTTTPPAPTGSGG